MKTSKFCQTLAIAGAFLATFILSVQAQNLSINSVDRYLSDDSSAQDGITFPAYESGGQTTDTNLADGIINIAYDQQGGVALANVHTDTFQDSTITSSLASLSVSGALHATYSASGSHDSLGDYGIVNGNPDSMLTVDFSIDQPFSYQLTALTSSTSSGTSNPTEKFAAFVALETEDSSSNYFTFGGASGFGGAVFPTSGSVSGTLPAGRYVFQVTAVDEIGWNISPVNTVGDFDFSADRSVTFSFDVTASLPPAPVIQSLTSDGSGGFQLSWTAAAAGNYQIMSSTDLVNWAVYTSPANYPAGLNATSVGYLPGSSCGFFRIQYLP